MLQAALTHLRQHPALGVAASLSGSAVTFLSQLELVFRVAGAAVGLCIGVMTLVISWPRFAEAVRSWRSGGTRPGN
jgi:hypothetical protein